MRIEDRGSVSDMLFIWPRKITRLPTLTLYTNDTIKAFRGNTDDVHK